MTLVQGLMPGLAPLQQPGDPPRGGEDLLLPAGRRTPGPVQQVPFRLEPATDVLARRREPARHVATLVTTFLAEVAAGDATEPGLAALPAQQAAHDEPARVRLPRRRPVRAG
jgi:hypothetical protein